MQNKWNSETTSSSISRRMGRGSGPGRQLHYELCHLGQLAALSECFLTDKVEIHTSHFLTQARRSKPFPNRKLNPYGGLEGLDEVMQWKGPSREIQDCSRGTADSNWTRAAQFSYNRQHRQVHQLNERNANWDENLSMGTKVAVSLSHARQRFTQPSSFLPCPSVSKNLKPFLEEAVR